MGSRKFTILPKDAYEFYPEFQRRRNPRFDVRGRFRGDAPVKLRNGKPCRRPEPYEIKIAQFIDRSKYTSAICRTLRRLRGVGRPLKAHG